MWRCSVTDKPVTRAILETGLFDEAAAAQLRRWGLLTTVAEEQNFKDPDAVVDRIRQAMEGEDLVELRDTDLDVVRTYLNDRVKGKLCVPTPEDESRIVPLKLEYCLTKMGEYVIPWMSEGIQDLLLHEKPRAFRRSWAA